MRLAKLRGRCCIVLLTVTLCRHVATNLHSTVCQQRQQGPLHHPDATGVIVPTLVKVHVAGFPLSNLSRLDVYLAEEGANARLQATQPPPSCAGRRPVPAMLAIDHHRHQLTFELIERLPAMAIPVGVENDALARCLYEFLRLAQVRHGDLMCRHLVWTHRHARMQLVLMDFDMATTTTATDSRTRHHNDSGGDRLLHSPIVRAQLAMQQRRVGWKGWLPEAPPPSLHAFVAWVQECAERRRAGLDDVSQGSPLRPCATTPAAALDPFELLPTTSRLPAPQPEGR